MTLYDYLKLNNLGTDRASRMLLAQDLGMTDYVYGDATGNMEMLKRLRAKVAPLKEVVVVQEPASFVKVASPDTKIYPVDWGANSPLHGVTYVDPNKRSASGYDFTPGNTNWKVVAAKRMSEHPEDELYIREIQDLLAEEGAYDNQLYDLSPEELIKLLNRMKVLGKYAGASDGKISDDVIQAYRAINVDGKYGTRTETALLQPDRQLVAPARRDNTITHEDALSINPGNSIRGGQYPVIEKVVAVEAPEELAYPELVPGNWVKTYTQDLGGGDIQGYNLFDRATGKSIRYARDTKKKAQIEAEAKARKEADKKESVRKLEAEALAEQFVKDWAAGKVSLKTGGRLNYAQYLK